MTKHSEVSTETIKEAIGRRSAEEQTSYEAYQKYYAERRARIVGRVSSRILNSANKGSLTTEVRGGPLGLKRTKHSMDVLEAVAEQLDEKGVTIAVYRALEHGYFHTGICTVATVKEFQVAKVTKLDGEPVTPPYHGDEREQIFPPQPN
jgi:hypothetical protein